MQNGTPKRMSMLPRYAIWVSVMVVWSTALVQLRDAFGSSDNPLDFFVDMLFAFFIVAGYIIIAKVADRWYVDRVSLKYGSDPYAISWDRRLGENGRPCCPNCGSGFFLPPSSRLPEDVVCCGDCGQTIVDYANFMAFAERERNA